MQDAPRHLPTHMTVPEFIAWHGGGTAERFELVDGEVRPPMSPASSTHGILQAELARVIGNRLIEAGLTRMRVIAEASVQPYARASVNLRVPDIAITGTVPAAGEIIAPDPVVLIEILSPGNAADTWSNVWTYTTIPSVREILVISSFEIEARLLVRDSAGHWPADPATISPGGLLELHAIGLTLPLVELYAQTYLAHPQS